VFLGQGNPISAAAPGAQTGAAFSHRRMPEVRPQKGRPCDASEWRAHMRSAWMSMSHRANSLIIKPQSSCLVEQVS